LATVLEDSTSIPEAFREKIKPIEPDSIYSKIFEKNTCEWECLNKIAMELSEPFDKEFSELKKYFSLDENKKELTEVFKMQYR